MAYRKQMGGDEDGDEMSFFGPKLGGLGPKPGDHYIKIERLNDKLVEYRASMIAATNGKAASKAYKQSHELAKKFGQQIDNLTLDQVNSIGGITMSFRALNIFHYCRQRCSSKFE